ncbi:leucyl/phenylalanyl-tRNA--protein transferase [Alteraurantiacibacter buctensis]|uniref:Leucyl/phenylalanyl-tRNA--protein transferase n=1 Tax=Alteraurantiacibacter buctensis TaxID=1503981 RepID=A0A844YUD5_9SPHN|nr:leucyl/phenylalanyl-tRNA--protein transferase [Alteraurantiacibacter buctensis]MXO70114.1 leucyl/phenylalanyl-tRNA--protein transferase [Alteraurantiacibacter buctensis]
MHAPTTPASQPELTVDLLLLAYRSGIFPMSDSRDDQDVFWVEPRQRAIIPLDGFHLSRSLARVVKQDRFRVTCNAAFARVIRECAAPRADHPDTWINPLIEDSYNALHRAGHAHSIECWLDGELAGGLYGVSFERVFCGESMFSRADNASKVALAWLVALMRHAGYRLLDCQFITDHLASLGAVTVPRKRYLQLLADARADGFQASLPQAWAQFSAGASSAGAGAGSSAAGAAAAAGAALAAPVERATGASSPGKLIAQSLTHTS